MSDLSRRDLLRILSLSGGSAVLGPLAGRGGSPGAPSNTPLDVAVVGAGVSGVYAAWRLIDEAHRRAGGRLAVAVFEQSDRVGGRVHSVTPSGMPHLCAEMGAMRFPSTHTLVVELVKHLGLPQKPFPVTGQENRLYLRGRRFRQRDWNLPGVLPYSLPEADRRKSVDDLLIEGIEHYVPAARTLDARAWDRLKETPLLDGKPLADQSFWNLLLRAKGAETLHMIRDAGGYGSFYRSWNAGEMMSWVMADFLGNPRYWTLRDGYDSLPREMARRFTALGGSLWTGHRLRHLDLVSRSESPWIRLGFTDSRGEEVAVHHARHVILALPRRAVELLDPSSFLWEAPRLREDLRSVSPQPAAKIFLGYPQPWWTDLGLRDGRSITDLPIRQCYYMGTEGEQPGADPSNRSSLLMASYHDDAEESYWRAFQTLSAPGELQASDALVAEAHRQIGELHGAERIPEPSLALYKDWTQDPFGGAWHFWNVHTRPMEVIPRMRQPLPDIPLYLCGEAWSTDQGWVRGALQTAERLLEERFGLSRPSWLPDDVYLGP